MKTIANKYLTENESLNKQIFEFLIHQKPKLKDFSYIYNLLYDQCDYDTASRHFLNICDSYAKTDIIKELASSFHFNTTRLFLLKKRYLDIIEKQTNPSYPTILTYLLYRQGCEHLKNDLEKDKDKKHSICQNRPDFPPYKDVEVRFEDNKDNTVSCLMVDKKTDTMVIVFSMRRIQYSPEMKTSEYILEYVDPDITDPLYILSNWHYINDRKTNYLNFQPTKTNDRYQFTINDLGASSYHEIEEMLEYHVEHYKFPKPEIKQG